MTAQSADPEPYKTRGDQAWVLVADGPTAALQWPEIEAFIDNGLVEYERFNVILEDVTIHFDLASSLVLHCGGESAVVAVLQHVLNTVPDRLRLYHGLSQNGERNEVTFPVFEALNGPLILKASDKVAVLQSSVARLGALGRALLGVLVLRGLRERLPGPHGAARLKRDVGTALLALGGDSEAKGQVTGETVTEQLGPLLDVQRGLQHSSPLDSRELVTQQPSAGTLRQ